MRHINTILILLLIGSSACFRTNKPDQSKESQPATVNITHDTVKKDSLKNEYYLMGILYHQISGEYKALCYQAYNLGKLMLDKDLADKSIDQHRAVVLDIDETVLDNSPYQAQMVLGNFNYPVKWDEWCKKASAEAIPGALDFLNYAKMNGVSIFYVTNRKDQYKQVTIENLMKLGFPFADEAHVLTRSSTDNSKEGRRSLILQKHHISLLFGDNLADFNDMFDNKSNPERIAAADRLKEDFGKRFIVLPNSMYGDWETALYDKNMPDSVKQMMRLKALKGF